MRKVFIGMFLLISTISFSQTAYYDALKLRKYVQGSSNELDALRGDKDYIKILRSYVVNGDSIDDDSLLRYYKAKNPFINKFLSSGASSGLSINSGKSSGFFSSISSLNVTTFADGAAKFIVERAKEEFNVAFFQKLQKLSAKYPEFKKLFPRTEIFLTSFEPWDYANILITIREAFDKDLKRLIPNILSLSELKVADCKDDKQCTDRIKALNDFFAQSQGRITLSVFQIANGFLEEQKIPDIIHTISSADLLGGIQEPDVSGSLKLIDIISYSLINNEVGKSYIPVSEFTDMMRDSITRNLYLGLIYQQLKNNNVVINRVNLADSLGTNYSSFENYITRFLIEGKDVLDSYEKIREAKRKGETDLDKVWSNLFSTANDFILHLYNIETLSAGFQLPQQIKNVLASTNRLLEIAHDIAVKNYNAAVLGALSFLTEKFDNNSGLTSFKIFFSKYGSFAANVVHAENSDEVKAAIKAVALPAGSASIKKHTHFNIALNAYLGGFYGSEYLANKKLNRTQNVSGITAPIGITCSWQLHVLGQDAISVFLPVIDVGSFASFRLKDSTTTDLPKVTLQNIFSPGLGIVYGIADFPLSIGYIWQYGPALREISATQATVSENINHRGIFFIAVDIPVFNFYNKTRTLTSIKNKK